MNGWGGRREGAGRKRGKRRTAAHRVRPEHHARHPVHVTLRADRPVPSLRKQRVFVVVRRALAKASRTWFRLLHFSVQADHVHLLVEAHDKVSLSRGMAGLAIRVARGANRVLGRRGRLWAQRYHARPLRTPADVRRGLVYVLTNWVKHVPGARHLDPFSSAYWFDGWKLPPTAGPPDWRDPDPPVVKPRTWLANAGWRRGGLVAANEHPKLSHEPWRSWVG
jgi:REP element-mobilizing transposase RayT